MYLVHSVDVTCDVTPFQSQGSAEAVEEKTEFTVKLVKYSEDSKIKLIKEVKTLVEGMNLVQVCVYVWECVLESVLLYGHEASLLGTLIDGQHRQKREQRGTQRGTATAKLSTPSLHL